MICAILDVWLNALKPRLHQIHLAGYKYPGRATCIRIQVDTCRRNAALTAILSPIQNTICRRRQGIQVDTTVSGLRVSDINAALHCVLNWKVFTLIYFSVSNIWHLTCLTRYTNWYWDQWCTDKRPPDKKPTWKRPTWKKAKTKTKYS